MRTAGIVYGGVIMIILVIMILSLVTMKSSYSDQISQSLDDALELAIYMCRADVENKTALSNSSLGSESNWVNKLYSDSDREKSIAWTDESLSEFKQDFVKYLVQNLDARVYSLDVDIYGADEEYGMLSVKVTAHFYYPGVAPGGGQPTDEVSTYKTVILNRETINDPTSI